MQPHNEAKGAKAFCNEKAFGYKGTICFANITTVASALFVLFTNERLIGAPRVRET
jgi:hypothetical protein